MLAATDVIANATNLCDCSSVRIDSPIRHSITDSMYRAQRRNGRYQVRSANHVFVLPALRLFGVRRVHLAIAVNPFPRQLVSKRPPST